MTKSHFVEITEKYEFIKFEEDVIYSPLKGLSTKKKVANTKHIKSTNKQHLLKLLHDYYKIGNMGVLVRIHSRHLDAVYKLLKFWDRLGGVQIRNKTL